MVPEAAPSRRVRTHEAVQDSAAAIWRKGCHGDQCMFRVGGGVQQTVGLVLLESVLSGICVLAQRRSCSRWRFILLQGMQLLSFLCVLTPRVPETLPPRVILCAE